MNAAPLQFPCKESEYRVGLAENDAFTANNGNENCITIDLN